MRLKRLTFFAIPILLGLALLAGAASIPAAADRNGAASRALVASDANSGGASSEAVSGTASAWLTETVETGLGQHGGHTSLALDDDSYAHISYFDETNDDLKYAHQDASGWHTDTVDTAGNSGRYTALALDGEGSAHISYFDWDNHNLKYAYWDASGWVTETVDTGLGQHGGHTSLALDADGYPHVSYFDWAKYDLRYACPEDAGWFSETVDHLGWVGQYPSLALDGSGNPHISYRDYGNEDLKYAFQDVSGWHTRTVDSEGEVGMYTSLALDESSDPHISYYDATNGDLKYAYRDALGWHTQLVDSEGDVGMYASLKLDEHAVPHISYYDASNGDLKYAHQHASGWHIQRVDGTGDVGQYTSLALDKEGYPHISYFDGTRYALKHAYFGPLLAVTKRAASDHVQAGAWLTYTLYVTNTSDVSLLASVTDTLPGNVSPTGVITWTASIAPSDTWTKDFGVTVQSGYAGPLTNVVQATADEGASASDSCTVHAEEPIAGLSATSDGPTPLGRPTALTATIRAGSNVTYSWALGDGASDTGSTVSHIYPTHGTYEAVVTASNGVSLATASTTDKIIPPTYLPLIMRTWPPLPYQPTLYPISNPDGDGNYTVSWTEQPSRHADTYILEEATNITFTVDVREVCHTASQSCNVTGRSAGTYYYRVRGHNEWADGPYSEVESVMVSPPATPVIDPIANGDGDGTYTVAWDATARATSYTLQEGTGPAFSSPIDVYHGAGTAWDVAGKTAGTYYYRMQAHGPTGPSNWSETRSVTVLLPGTPTLHPIGNADEDGAYTVSWNATGRATSYELQEDTDSDFDSPQTAYQGSAVSWDVTGKAPDTYYYRVRALGPTGQSGWSNTRSVVVTPPPEEVAIMSSNAFVPYDGSSSLYIVGEVVNNTRSSVQFVKISATLRDGAGNVVDSDYSYSMIDTLSRNMKSPFLVPLWDPPAWSSYELTVDWDTTGSSPHHLEILNTNSYFDNYDEYHVVGEIKNQTSDTRTFVKAFVTMYDSNGEVIGADYSYTNPDELAPGQTASFDTGVYFWKGKPNRSNVASHSLQVLDD